MTIDPRVTLALFWTELKSALRDRRTVVLSILLPALVTPGLLYLSRQSETSHEQKLKSAVHAYAVTGPEAALARELIAEAQAVGAQEARFREVASEDPGAALDRGTIQ
ncbi:MAG: hypothetical protein MUC67_13250, partial [Acidobacteria bacterium]|nr:hypothetical protein [Acidobacteriota bacterium]